MAKGKYFTGNKDFLELVLPLDIVVRKLFVPILFLIAVASTLYGIPYPLIPLTGIALVFVVVSGLFLWLIKQGLVPGTHAYFVLLLIDSVLATLAVYYSGGIESFAPLIYAVVCVLAGLTLPLRGMLIVTTTSAALYFLELTLETHLLIPHVRLFTEFFPPEMYANSAFMRIIPMAHLVVGITVVFLAYTVAEILRQRTGLIKGTNIELDRSSKLLVRRDLDLQTLNQELDEKLHELEELKGNLENMVKQRTVELEAKIKELQEFYDATVGRELKMIDLEKEIDSLLRELGREPRYK